MNCTKLLLLFITLVMSCTLILAAQVGEVTKTNPVQPSRVSSFQTNAGDAVFQTRDPRYRLRKSDVIDVKFKFSPEFDQIVTVQPDGFITLDGAGDIKVENKTLPEVTIAIRQAYAGTLHDPAVTVSLKDFDKPFFIAAGQVGHPGKYELRSDTTLIEAVNIAGGLTDASKHSQVVLFRRASDATVEARVFNVKQMLGSHNLQEDPHLSPGDMVFVPQNGISKIRHYLPIANVGTYVNPAQF